MGRAKNSTLYSHGNPASCNRRHIRARERETNYRDVIALLCKREREIHYVQLASLAYEDGIVFMSEPSAARQ